MTRGAIHYDADFFFQIEFFNILLFLQVGKLLRKMLFLKTQLQNQHRRNLMRNDYRSKNSSDKIDIYTLPTKIIIIRNLQEYIYVNTIYKRINAITINRFFALERARSNTLACRLFIVENTKIRNQISAIRLNRQ